MPGGRARLEGPVIDGVRQMGEIGHRRADASRHLDGLRDVQMRRMRLRTQTVEHHGGSAPGQAPAPQRGTRLQSV